MQGDTVVKKVKELNDVKVIIVSTYVLEEKMVEELKQSGNIVDFIKKAREHKLFNRKDRELLTWNTA